MLSDGCRSAASRRGGKQYPIPTLDQAVAAVAKTPGAEIYAEVKVKQTAPPGPPVRDDLKIARMTDRTVVTSGIPGELGQDPGGGRRTTAWSDLRLMQFVSGESPARARGQPLGVAVKSDVVTKAYVKALNDAGPAGHGVEHQHHRAVGGGGRWGPTSS